LIISDVAGTIFNLAWTFLKELESSENHILINLVATMELGFSFAVNLMAQIFDMILSSFGDWITGPNESTYLSSSLETIGSKKEILEGGNALPIYIAN
jgi:hypothetical protein